MQRSLPGRALALALLVTAAAGPGAMGASRGDLSAVDVEGIRQELAAALEAGDDAERFDAQVWLTAVEPRLARFIDDPEARLLVLERVWREARRHDLDAELALALIEVESTFDRFAVSTAGAQGLMQVMPFWKLELGRRDDNLTDPVTNIRYGMAILAHYVDREQGNVVRALTRYHGNTRDLSYPERVFRAWNRRWRTRPMAEVHELMAACYAAYLRTCDP